MGDQIIKRKSFKYETIFNRLKTQIENGLFNPNQRFYSIRYLMESETISLATANRVFQELESERLIYSQSRSGYFVSEDIQGEALQVTLASNLPDQKVSHLNFPTNSQQKKKISFESAVLDEAFTPKSLLNRILVSISKSENLAHARLIPPPGLTDLRRGIARLMQTRGVVCRPDDVLITAGDGAAFELALRAVTNPGDSVAIESPTYFGILQAIEKVGLNAIEILTDPHNGICLNDLRDVVHKNRIACVFLNPTLHNPLGFTMSNENRRLLMNFLNMKKIVLIEDDVFYDLYDEKNQLRPIKSFDEKGIVIYCSSFSKVISPGYRIGWCLPGIFYKKIEYQMLNSNLSHSSLPQIILSEFLKKGYYDKHIKILKKRLSNYSSVIFMLVIKNFPSGTRVSRPAGGYIFWIELPTILDTNKICAAALTKGISITPGQIFSASSIGSTTFRICLGCPLTRDVISAIECLGSICKSSHS